MPPRVSGVGKIRPMAKIHGGDYYSCEKIASYFPPHNTYVEPYGGQASVLLNKVPSPVEVYNEINPVIVKMFLVLRKRADELQKALQLTPYSDLEFANSLNPPKKQDVIEEVRRFIVKCRMSMGGKGKSISLSLHRSRRGMADCVSGWLSAIDENLPMIVSRLRQVMILNLPALQVIAKWDSEDSLIYCDPPYMGPERSSRGCYDFDMTVEDHKQLATLLKSCKSKVVLAGYNSPEYADWYKDWHKLEFDVANNSAVGESKTRKTDCLWFNYEPKVYSQPLKIKGTGKVGAVKPSLDFDDIFDSDSE